MLNRNNFNIKNDEIGILFSFTKLKGISFSPHILYFLFMLCILFLLTIILFRRLLYLKLVSPLLCLRDHIKNKSTTHVLDPYINDITNSYSELIEIKFAFEKLLIDLKKENERHTELEKMKAIFNVAASVSHDITSPLAVLNIVTANLTELQEDKRILIRSAVSRIKDITNHILLKNRSMLNTAHNNSIQSTSQELRSPQLLSSLIEDIIIEKRIQYCNKPDITIMYDITIISYSLFANIQPIEFKRSISNLLNNSVEALGCKGKVNLQLRSCEQNIEIQISDNGPGIPSSILEKLGTRGVTHGKPDGNGLGLFQARTMCQENEATLHIQSKVNNGTDIIINIPKAVPPSWFVSEIKLHPKSIIIILDDDFSIKTVWQQKLNAIRVDNYEIETYYSSSINDLKTYNRNLDKDKNIYYFLDYEIAGETTSGLDIAENLIINSTTILVTSHWNESTIQNRCINLGIKLLPKSLVGFIPLTINY